MSSRVHVVAFRVHVVAFRVHVVAFRVHAVDRHLQSHVAFPVEMLHDQTTEDESFDPRSNISFPTCKSSEMEIAESSLDCSTDDANRFFRLVIGSTQMLVPIDQVRASPH